MNRRDALQTLAAIPAAYLIDPDTGIEGTEPWFDTFEQTEFRGLADLIQLPGEAPPLDLPTLLDCRGILPPGPLDSVETVRALRNEWE